MIVDCTDYKVMTVLVLYCHDFTVMTTLLLQQSKALRMCKQPLPI